jgi:hypothetical protein
MDTIRIRGFPKKILTENITSFSIKTDNAIQERIRFIDFLANADLGVSF